MSRSKPALAHVEAIRGLEQQLYVVTALLLPIDRLLRDVSKENAGSLISMELLLDKAVDEASDRKHLNALKRPK